MGQKVNPHCMRVGIIKDWNTKWYADKKDFANYLVEDHKIKKILEEQTIQCRNISHRHQKSSDKVKIIVFTAKPGVVIGKGGRSRKVKAQCAKLIKAKRVFIDIKEVKKPDMDAQLVAENIALQLENRVSFREL